MLSRVGRVELYVEFASSSLDLSEKHRSDMEAMMIAGEEHDMRRLCNGVLGVLDIFEL